MTIRIAALASLLAGMGLAAPIPILFDDAAAKALWSEDGTRIAVTTREHNLVSVDAKTGRVDLLVKDARDASPIYFDSHRLVVERRGELMIFGVTAQAATLEKTIDAGAGALARLDQNVVDADIPRIVRCVGSARLVAVRALEKLVVIDAAAGTEVGVIERRDPKGRELLGCAGNDLFLGTEARSADQHTGLVRIDLATGRERERTSWKRQGEALAVNRRGQLLLSSLYDADPAWLRLVDARSGKVMAQVTADAGISRARFFGLEDAFITTDAQVLDGVTLAERWRERRARVAALSPDGTRVIRFFDQSPHQIAEVTLDPKKQSNAPIGDIDRLEADDARGELLVETVEGAFIYHFDSRQWRRVPEKVGLDDRPLTSIDVKTSPGPSIPGLKCSPGWKSRCHPCFRCGDSQVSEIDSLDGSSRPATKQMRVVEDRQGGQRLLFPRLVSSLRAARSTTRDEAATFGIASDEKYRLRFILVADGKLVFTPQPDGAVWDAKSGRVLRTLAIPAPLALALPDVGGTRVLYASRGEIGLVDVGTRTKPIQWKTPLAIPPRAEGEIGRALAVSSRRREVYLGLEDGSIVVFSLEDGKLLPVLHGPR